MKTNQNLAVFSGGSNPALAAHICKYLHIAAGKIDINAFQDGECSVKIGVNVRGKDVFVIQGTCPPVNDNLMILLTIIDALRRASAKRITAVMPYYGYARQDRKAEPRVPITAKLVANLITASGADRVLSLELHAGQIQGFFDIPVDNLYPSVVFVERIRKMKLKNSIVVSPDAGGVDRARSLAKHIRADLAIVDKRRPGPNKAKILNIIGNVKDKTCLIYDDIIDTAGTAAGVAKALKKKGAGKIYLLGCHAVLSGNAILRLEKAPLEKIIVTNSIPIKTPSKKIECLSVGKLFAQAINCIHNETSLSSLFKMKNLR
ncbi:MAG: phosphoribosylpyrophosphate synthetase [Elusimicrobia bacterium CG03_land_8_20_14_0_80_50_18]|nr:MAG: phosphoribosylpyrophosphate synthetase [Elusimicrobia bacterium CG03_land_8_20_14_0_80_50_18]PIX15093.1 MAG: phosphoribosylpyrophosphate synthetase [Elusimicrobia bacterium CG_4_8_14_3_um_filter_50_9]